MQSSSLSSISPSFNSYSSSTTNLADIAARVVKEIGAQSDEFGFDYDDMYNFKEEEVEEEEELPQAVVENAKDDAVNSDGDGGEDDDEFEFAFVSKETDSSPISADDIFYNGQIRPVFPLFNRDLLLEDYPEVVAELKKSSKPPVRIPLLKLFKEERDSPSCSSSDADELEGLSRGSYCVWNPKAAAEEEELSGRCKKSSSTGTSKGWKIRHLPHRSSSDGKDAFVFFNPKRNEKVEKGAKLGGGESDGVSATETQKAVTGRRSFLQYKQDLVGLFANVNGLSRNLHPF